MGETKGRKRLNYEGGTCSCVACGTPLRREDGPLATAADSHMKQQGGTKAHSGHALLLHRERVCRGIGDCNTGPGVCATIGYR